MNSTLGNLPQWDKIQWKTTMEQVRNLKYRIFMAKLKGNRITLRRLQKLMLYSRHNMLLSVRAVTIVKDGKNIFGIRKALIKNKSDRMILVEKLNEIRISQYKPAPKVQNSNGKNIYQEIPILLDLCIQVMVLNALEPEWEACFEANSYGFRPGRNTHDAISRVFTVLSVKANRSNNKQWALNATIEGFFDNICEQDLLAKLDNFPAKSLIKRWLNIGYLEGNFFNKNERSIPKGAIISPLLANIVLDGLENIIKAPPDSRFQISENWVYIRYADRFIVLCSTKKEVQKIKTRISDWLKTKGLILTPNKMKISHIDKGFDFLGVNIRHVSTNVSHKTKRKILLIRPSKKAVHTIIQKLKNEWKYLRGKSIEMVLNRLNPIITSWADYHRKFSSRDVFKKLDNWTFQKSWQYASRMHANKSKQWIYNTYYGNFNLTQKGRWVFGNKQTGRYLKKFTWFNMQTHVMVKGYNSPCDPRLKQYWEQRQKTLDKANLTKLKHSET